MCESRNEYQSLHTMYHISHGINVNMNTTFHIYVPKCYIYVPLCTILFTLSFFNLHMNTKKKFFRISLHFFIFYTN